VYLIANGKPVRARQNDIQQYKPHRILAQPSQPILSAHADFAGITILDKKIMCKLSDLGIVFNY